jgi:hypothetical protein
MEKLLKLIGIVGASAITIAGSYQIFTSGVNVTIKNIDSVPLENVSVLLEGKTFELGEIEPGKAKSVRLNPSQKTEIYLAHGESNNPPKMLKVGEALEPGYQGNMLVEANREKSSLINNVVWH